MTYGSRGDVEPFVALAVGLQRAGHTVRLAAPAMFASLAQVHGVTFEPLAGDPDRLALALTDRAGFSGPRMVAQMVRHVLPLSASVFRAVEAASSDAEVIIHSFLLTEAGHTIANRRGIADFSAQLFPVFATTSAFPAVVFPDLRLGGGYRRITHNLNTAVFRLGGRLLYRRVRADAPDLPDLAPWPFDDAGRGPTPLLFAYSPVALPRPADWPASVRVTGYWNLAPAPGWSPPGSLVRFLEAGPPPLYFGVGSMRTRRMPELLDTVIQAVKATGQRALLGMPRATGEASSLPSEVFPADGVPHDWLFRHTQMVIHHGGAGTTGAALRAGVPSTAIPFTADQSFWARQIHRLGVGPPGVPALHLSAGGLATIIEEAIGDPRYRTRAHSVGDQLRQENGVASAIEFIEGRWEAAPKAAA
jgi:sterol 3beta-glucosyltransferase